VRRASSRGGRRDDDPRLRSTLLHQDRSGGGRTFEWAGRAAHASTDPWEGVTRRRCVATFNAWPCCASRCGPIAASTASSRRAAPPPHHPGASVADFNVRGPSLERCGALPRVMACAESAPATSPAHPTQHPDIYERSSATGAQQRLRGNCGPPAGRGPRARSRPLPDIGNVSQSRRRSTLGAIGPWGPRSPAPSSPRRAAPAARRGCSPAQAHGAQPADLLADRPPHRDEGGVQAPVKSRLALWRWRRCSRRRRRLTCASLIRSHPPHRAGHRPAGGA